MSRDVIEVTSECFAGNHSMCTEQIHKGRCECECHRGPMALDAARYKWIIANLDYITFSRAPLVVHLRCDDTLSAWIDQQILEDSK